MSSAQQIALLAVVVWVLYFDHAMHSAVLWWRQRTYRSLRNFYIAAMLLVGLTNIALAAIARAKPGVIFLNGLLDASRPILYGMLLVGGIVLAWTWRAEE